MSQHLCLTLLLANAPFTANPPAVTHTHYPGETWIDQLPVVDDSGELNYSLAGFLFSFILIVNWTLLQASLPRKIVVKSFFMCRVCMHMSVP
jgi:hypothetical protein